MDKNSLNKLIKKSNLNNTDYYIYNKSKTKKNDTKIKYNIILDNNLKNYVVLYIKEIDKEVIYISVIKILDNIIINKLESYIKPTTNLPIYSIEKLELSSINLENSPSLEEFSNTFITFINNLPIVIFDINSAINLVEKLNIENEILDLKYAIENSFPNLKRYSISYLSKNLLAIDNKDKTYITYLLYKKLKNI